MGTFLQGYFSQVELERFEAMGLHEDEDALTWLAAVVQQRHHRLHRLPHALRSREARLPVTAADQDLEREYGRLVQAWHRAHAEGDVNRAVELKAQLDAVGKRLFQGG